MRCRCLKSLWKTGQSSARTKQRREGLHLNATVDALGNPLCYRLTAGQRHNITIAQVLVSTYRADHVIAYTAYDTDKSIKVIEGDGTVVVFFHPQMVSNYATMTSIYTSTDADIQLISGISSVLSRFSEFRQFSYLATLKCR